MISNKEKEMFSFEISNDLKQKIRKYAFEHNLTLSKSVRIILEKFFEADSNDRFKE